MDYFSQFPDLYKYLIFFVTTIIEGPVISMVGGSLSSVGFFRIELIFLLALLGDIVADLLFYSIGRYGIGSSSLDKYTEFVKKKGFLSKKLKKNVFFYVFFIKFTPYLGVPGLLFAGFKKIPFRRFLIYSAIVSIIVKFTFVGIGYFGGIGVDKVSSFFDVWGKIVFWVISFVVFYFTVKLILSFGKKIIDKRK